MAVISDEIFGHSQVMSSVRQSFQIQKNAQTFLFVGPSGVGKKKVAFSLAQDLLCTQKTYQFKACGQCASCLKVSKQQHEGLFFVEPDGQQIKVDQVKEVLSFLNLQSLTAFRIIIIDEAHRLNLNAANSLLKSLEEPPAGVIYFLIAPSSASVLTTIRSRSQVVRFNLLSEMDLRRSPEAVNAPTWVFKAAQGRLEDLKSFLDNSEVTYRSQSFNLLNSFLMDPDFLYFDDWRQFVREKEERTHWSAYWALFLKDLLVIQFGDKALVNLDLESRIQDWKKELGLTSAEIQWLLTRILDFQQDLKFYRDSTLFVEELFYEFKGRNQRRA